MSYLVVNAEHVRDVDADLDDVDALGEGQLELGVVLRQAQVLVGRVLHAVLHRLARERQRGRRRQGQQQQPLQHHREAQLSAHLMDRLAADKTTADGRNSPLLAATELIRLSAPMFHSSATGAT